MFKIKSFLSKYLSYFVLGTLLLIVAFWSQAYVSPNASPPSDSVLPGFIDNTSNSQTKQGSLNIGGGDYVIDQNNSGWFLRNQETTETNLFLSNDGKLGLGTANPQVKLDLNGGEVRVRVSDQGSLSRCLMADDYGKITYVESEDNIFVCADGGWRLLGSGGGGTTNNCNDSSDCSGNSDMCFVGVCVSQLPAGSCVWQGAGGEDSAYYAPDRYTDGNKICCMGEIQSGAQCSKAITVAGYVPKNNSTLNNYCHNELGPDWTGDYNNSYHHVVWGDYTYADHTYPNMSSDINDQNRNPNLYIGFTARSKDIPFTSSGWQYLTKDSFGLSWIDYSNCLRQEEKILQYNADANTVRECRENFEERDGYCNFENTSCGSPQGVGSNIYIGSRYTCVGVWDDSHCPQACDTDMYGDEYRCGISQPARSCHSWSEGDDAWTSHLYADLSSPNVGIALDNYQKPSLTVAENVQGNRRLNDNDCEWITYEEEKWWTRIKCGSTVISCIR